MNTSVNLRKANSASNCVGEVHGMNRKVNPCFELTFQAAGDNFPALKMKFSTEFKLFALYSYKDEVYNLVDVFNSYQDANDRTRKLIDRTLGMKEKINCFFN